MNSYATLTRGSLWMLAFVMFSTGWAQAAPFMSYPGNNPSAVGTSMAETPTTFDASGTPGSS